jgi:hypothetical protein
MANASVLAGASAVVSADSVGGIYTDLTGPVLAEGTNGDIGTGTIVLVAPSGFAFNPNSTVTVTVTEQGGGPGTLLTLQSTNASVTATSASITVTATDTGGSSGPFARLTWAGLQVQPTAASPLASGQLTNSGSASISRLSAPSTYGTLTEVAGVAVQLAFAAQPGGATAGAAFSQQPVVVSQDQFGNDSTNGLPAHSIITVSLTSGTGPLQGTTTVDLGIAGGKGVAGYRGLRIDTAGSGNQLTATATNGLAGALSGLFTVSPAKAGKLAVGTQPSASATAGVPFANQPVIWIEDAYDNLCTSNTAVVKAACGAGGGALRGATNMAAQGGIASFTNLAALLATNLTIEFTSGSLTPTNSAGVAVSAGPFSQLQVLLPGQTAAPGTLTGMTGSPSAQTDGTAFSVVVNAVDLGFNPVSSATDQIAIGSSDANALLPASASLINGTNLFTVTLETAGSRTVTASDLTNGGIPETSSSVTVDTAPFTKLQVLLPGETAAPGTPTGKTGTAAAQTAGAAYKVTVRSVDLDWNLVKSGDTVQLYSTDTNAVLPAAAALSEGIQTFSLTNKTEGSQTVTASDVTELFITNGSAVLTVNSAAASALAIGTQPSATAVAGLAFAQEPVVYIEDQFGNIRSNDTAIVKVKPSAGLLFGGTNVAAMGGVATFTNLADTLATNLTLVFTSGALTAATSSIVAITPGAYARLQVLLPGQTAAPGTTAGVTGGATPQADGTAFSILVSAVDTNWNVVTNITDRVAISSSDANALLPASASLINGTDSFAITLVTDGSQTVTASDLTLGSISGISSAVSVTNAGFSKLQVLLPGETAAPGTPTGKTGTPAIQTAGIAYKVAVNSVDLNWNVVKSSDVVQLSSTDTNAVLPSAAALSGGTRNFTVTDRTPGTWTFTVQDNTNAGISNGTSAPVTVIAGAPASVRVETEPDGSGTTVPAQDVTSGSSLTGYAILRDADGNFLTNIPASSWSLTNLSGYVASGDLVPASDMRSAVFTGHGTGHAMVRVTSSTLSSVNSGVLTVVPGPFTQLQALLPGQAAAPGTATGKTGIPTTQTVGVAYEVRVNAADASWNLVQTNDTVQLASSDATSKLPASAPLVNGTRVFSIIDKTAGAWTVTASDVTHPAITPGTSSTVTVNAGGPAKPQVQPLVAIHDSELTRALASIPATNGGPTGPYATGFEWWLTNWNYFVMPDSVKEALRSDGTAFTTLGDSNIAAGQLLGTNGQPNYPILISLGSEAIDDSEIAVLTNYVAAGGTLLVGGSSFTRSTNGATRGDFAIASAMGIHMVNASLFNWVADTTFSKLTNHSLVAHIPGGSLIWNMPVSADEVSWGVSPTYALSQGHLVWQVQASNALAVAQGDVSPYLLVNSFGKGTVIYIAALEPFLAHGGNAPGMYAYGILRNAIVGAFASFNLPITKLSPWPFPYAAALEVRHDFENFQNQIPNIPNSAQFEAANGAKGDYYFCTGTLRVEMTNSPSVIAGLCAAVTNSGATIGPHNGGLPNINNLSLVLSNYDYWHWGTDEALGAPAANLPSGYSSTTNYALVSFSNSFVDVEGWLGSLTNGLRLTVSPHFNATRETSYQMQQQLGVKATGEQKLGPFPSWVLSTATPDLRYSFISVPTSEWYIVPPTVAQSMESSFTPGTMEQMIDFYYNLGGLINLYSHSPSDGTGLAGPLASEYVTYSMGKPRIWPANMASIYTWWLARSNAQVSAIYSTNGSQSIVTFNISGALDPHTAVEALVPRQSVSGLQVFTNGVAAGTNVFWTDGPLIKVLVGTNTTNAQLTYFPDPVAQSNLFTVPEGTVLSSNAPGLLAGALPGATGGNLTAVLAGGPSFGSLSLTNNGGFAYTPATNFIGIDSFTWFAHDAVSTSTVTRATVDVTPPGDLIFDNFFRSTNSDPLAPWTPVLGSWTIGGGQLQGTGLDVGLYSDLYLAGNWTNYSIQGQVQFPASGFGGGLAGRLNPVTGAKYAVSIYPSGIPGVTSSPLMRLEKFHDWQVLGPSALQQVNLPTIGTNWHTIEVTFRNQEILAYFDGIQVMDVVDNDFDSLPAYTGGGVGVHFYTYEGPYTMSCKNVLVTVAPIVADAGYTAIENQTLTVAAPGVLSNDLPGIGTNLTAILVSGPANGALSLNTNGGFTYAPSANYTGTDSFSYVAADGVSTSAIAMVTITILSNSVPVANNDSYSYTANTPLIIPAPGVLANDTDAAGFGLIPFLVSPPLYGSLTLSTNGGFTYVPKTNFTGLDSFAYADFDGFATSGVATVTLTDPAYGSLFYDNFARATDPGPLAPWVAQSGVWTVTGGALVGGPNGESSYGIAYVTNSWTDYAVQGQFQFAAGAYGGGLGGRVNPATGARYTAWIYPSGNNLNLLKFQNWQTAPYPAAFLAQINLPPPGTNWHTLKLAFRGNQIAVHYDGNLVVSLADNSSPYLSGGVSVDMYTDFTAYQLSVDDIAVDPLAMPDSYYLNENATLTVPAAGVLGNDTGVFGTNLAAALVSGPNNGALNLSGNGGFSYTPATGFTGTDTFTYQASDNVTNLGSAVVTLTVNPVPPPPPRQGIGTNGLVTITSILPFNGKCSITWNSVVGQTYTLQYKSKLTDTNWQDSLPALTASQTNTTATDALAGSTQKFYRVKVGP